MTRDETKKLLKEITLLFPRFMESKEDKTMKVDLWTEVLQDTDYKKTHGALIKYSQTANKGFAPSAGQLLELIDEDVPFSEPYLDDEHEFWGYE